jgi:hypothetical protein
MTIEIDAGLVADARALEAEDRKRWKDYVDPETPGRRYFHIDFDCVGYTIVAESEVAAKAMMPGIHALMCGCVGDETPDPTFEEALANHGLDIAEIPGTATIWDDGRDGLQHPINTYPLGTWASTEY